MYIFDQSVGSGERLLVGGAPEGQQAFVLASLARRSTVGVLHIAVDEASAVRTAEVMRFFCSDIETLIFPAWDCLPYSQISPHPTTIGRRLSVLHGLRGRTRERGCVLLTTVNAVVQRIQPSSTLEGTLWTLSCGELVSVSRLYAYLSVYGYVRTKTVYEAGDYAVRGGIIDIFSPLSLYPVRLDLFGERIESMRIFDALTQRTISRCEEVTLVPVTECGLDREAIERFRTNYRMLCLSAPRGDGLYEAVSMGQRYKGMEHWLPLFYERMETLFDYVPGAYVTLDYGVEDVYEVCFEQIERAYTARCQDGGTVMCYVPLERFYLDRVAWAEVLGRRSVVVFSPFEYPPEQGNTFNAGGRRHNLLFSQRAQHLRVNVFDYLRDHIASLRRERERIVIIACYSDGSCDRIHSLFKEHGILDVRRVVDWGEIMGCDGRSIFLTVLGLEYGFENAEFCLFTEQDIFGERLIREIKRRRGSAKHFFAEMLSFTQGDLVVHVDYGIGRYEGLETLDVRGASHDFLRLVYEGGSKLYIPVENMEVLSRYSGEEGLVSLDRLGRGSSWYKRRERVARRLRDIAESLVDTMAARLVRVQEPLSVEREMYESFCMGFRYVETEDQLQAIEDVLSDLGSGRTMDRLICGDAGFGKTEVALRAAFVVALSGLQVAVLAPTTLLVRQHYQTFIERFAGIPVRIESLSRFGSREYGCRVREGLGEGLVDIVIGTHAILSKGVRFKRLGLVVIDEEQHFGVRQKEVFRSLRTHVHVLTLTATPIPRTLHMALSEVYGMSMLTTPPVDRLVVRTFVLPYDDVVIRGAILRECERGGQCFYVCPRIGDLGRVREYLKTLVPEVKVVVVHGKVAVLELEETMRAFDRGVYQVLLSTNIIESGLDLPNVNTLIVHRSDCFGLAQLYQLRGRVGRSKQRGYAYFTYDGGGSLTEGAQRRLQVIQTLDSLSVGFQVASQDMDIRGVGNLLGEEQSGHIKEVGVELFQQMLDDAVRRTKLERMGDVVEGGGCDEGWIPQISLNIPVLIPEWYISDLYVRLVIYRRLSLLTDQGMIDGFGVELVDRFGVLPVEVENLLRVVGLKRLCRVVGVKRLVVGEERTELYLDEGKEYSDEFIGYLCGRGEDIQLLPEYRLLYRSYDVKEVYIFLESLVQFFERGVGYGEYRGQDCSAGT